MTKYLAILALAAMCGCQQAERDMKLATPVSLDGHPPFTLVRPGFDWDATGFVNGNKVIFISGKRGQLLAVPSWADSVYVGVDQHHNYDTIIFNGRCYYAENDTAR